MLAFRAFSHMLQVPRNFESSKMIHVCYLNVFDETTFYFNAETILQVLEFIPVASFRTKPMVKSRPLFICAISVSVSNNDDDNLELVMHRHLNNVIHS